MNPISLCRPSALRAAVTTLLLLGFRLSAASTDYLVDGWDTENNLPSSTVTSIAQTRDGYLWVGTYNGLARFDGTRFVTFDPVNTPQLSQTRVQGLFLDANGTLWINTFRGGLTSYRDGQFRLELPDERPFDQHTTLVSSTSNLVTFVTQAGEVLRRNPLATNHTWDVKAQPGNARAFFHCADRDRTLWFLTRDRHILRFIDNAFKELPGDGGLPGGHINTMVADDHGVVWAGADNVIARWNGKEFEDMTPTNSGKTEIQPLQLFPTKSGALWVLNGDRLRKMEGRAWVAEATQWRGLLGSAAGRGMGSHEDRDGGLWFNHYGNGLFHILPDGHFQRLTTANGLPGDRVGAWFQSNDGGIWAGVDHGGLARLRDRRFHVIGPAEGLPARTALSVCGDTNGTVFVGTAGGGLCTLQGGEISRYSVGSSDSANFVFAIAPRPDGGAWLSASEGEDLFEYTNGRVQRVSWDVHGVKSILLDRRGRIWMGLKAGLAWWSGNDRQIINTSTNGVLPAFRALAETEDGTIWAGADDGSIFRCTQEKLERFRAQDELAGQPVYSLYTDSSGTVWAGTFRGGLVRFRHGKFSRITAKQGLPVGIISQILEDHQGRLWLGTHQGIYCVSKQALHACMDGSAASVDYIAYGRHDGLPALECSDGYQPSCWHGPDGRLWFTTVRGVVWVNPDELIAKSSPPPVLIEELSVDGEIVPLNSNPVVILPGRQQYDFRFTALNFDAGPLGALQSDPGDRARFRYQLEGYSGWVDADTPRIAHFGPLPPRDYKFHVIACNNDGVWNNVGATIKITVQPYFYQTTWFLVLVCISVLGAVAYGVRRMALLKYRRKLAQMEKEHAIERDRARIARDIHDDVGAGLTQITLLTELARRNPEQTTANLERITQSARNLTKAMDEIVWAVDPQHDTVAGLMDYISAYAEDYLRVAQVRCRMDLPVDLPTAHVNAESRYNLFLALKEVLNNVVKHAQATEVRLGLELKPNAFTLSIEDNGRGLADARHGDAPAGMNRIASGSGLGNLEQRLAAIGGRCEIHSEPGRGTRVSLTVYLKERITTIGDWRGQNPPLDLVLDGNSRLGGEVDQ
jgi:signal transduction histidine kinase/ligand-binding sensor domain-containing protein